MQRAFGGYTLIEVMIFLAISSVLFAVSIVVIRGQAAHTEFTTSMNDVNTKLQQWVDEVVNGYSSNDSTALSAKYRCSLDALQYPQLSTVAPRERGSNYDCVFLGKAIQANTRNAFSGHLYAYSVIGRRTTLVDGVQTSVSNLADSNPIAAIFPQPPAPSTIDLTEEYQIPNGARLISATSDTAGYGDSHMAGFFSGFGANASNGASSLMAYNYGVLNNVTPRTSVITNCIKLKPVCLPIGPVAPMQNWKLCFASTHNNETALVTVNSSDGVGVTTKLEFVGCS